MLYVPQKLSRNTWKVALNTANPLQAGFFLPTGAVMVPTQIALALQMEG